MKAPESQNMQFARSLAKELPDLMLAATRAHAVYRAVLYNEEVRNPLLALRASIADEAVRNTLVALTMCIVNEAGSEDDKEARELELGLMS